MNTRALTLAIRLLSTAVTGVALGAMTGCPFIFGCGDRGWQESEDLALGVTTDLEALVEVGDSLGTKYWDYVAVGSAGEIVAWGTEDGEPFVETSALDSAVQLRAVTAVSSGWWVAGDDGVAAVSEDQGQTWNPIDVGAGAAALHAIAEHEAWLVVAGDDVVRVRTSDGSWVEAPAPVDGWGQLRALHSDGTRIYAVGRNGVAWSTTDPTGPWEAEVLETSAHLSAITMTYNSSSGDFDIQIVGAGGTVIRGSNAGGWTTLDLDLGDLIGADDWAVLTASGEVYELDGAAPRLVETFPGARALSFRSYGGVTVVGESGLGVHKDYYECIGGRPFMVDGQLRTASLESSAAWVSADADGDRSDADDNPRSVEDGDLAEALAAAWAQDGLYEHASVASFARFGLELMALGAPAQLLRDVQLAALDEIEHARLCFGLARRFGGVEVGPGPMPISVEAFARVGDPVATALALLDEGCINESVAACEAAEAASCATDPEVRAVLERIAADERRHATLAWAALRWLVDVHGAQVVGPLRSRIARLGPGPTGAGDDDPRLLGFGRLSPGQRAHVRTRVLAEFAAPMARALVSDLDISV